MLAYTLLRKRKNTYRKRGFCWLDRKEQMKAGGRIPFNVQTAGAKVRKTISWLYIYTLYPSALAVDAAAAALLKGLFIWLNHRLTVWLCHLTGSGPDSLSHWGSVWRISCSAAQHNEAGQNIVPDRAEEQNWRYKAKDITAICSAQLTTQSLLPRLFRVTAVTEHHFYCTHNLRAWPLTFDI